MLARVGRRFRIVARAAILGMLTISICHPALADWSPNPNATPSSNIIRGQTPVVACQKTIDYNNASFPNPNWKWVMGAFTSTTDSPYTCQLVCKANATPPVGTYTGGSFALYTLCGTGESGNANMPNGCISNNSPLTAFSFGAPCPTCGKNAIDPLNPQNGGSDSSSMGGTSPLNGMPSSGSPSRGGSNPRMFSTSVQIQNPTELATGNVSYSVTDYQTAGPNVLGFTRFYNSMTTGQLPTALGNNWRHTYDRYITPPINTAYYVERADGRKVYCYSDGSCSNGMNYTIKVTNVGATVNFLLTTPEDTIEAYTAATSTSNALLQSITYRNGYKLTLDRSVANTLKVTDSYGRLLQLNFSATDGTLTSINTPDGTTISYGYTTGYYMAAFMIPTANGFPRLQSVTYPDAPSHPVTYSYTGIVVTLVVGTTTVYDYNDTSSNSIPGYLLSSITDQNGNVSNSWTYDKYGRNTGNAGYNGTSPVTISYDSTTGNRTVTQASGISDTYAITTPYYTPTTGGITRAATATTPAATRSFGYQGYGYPYWFLDWNGTNEIVYNSYNSHGAPTQIIENYQVTANRRITNVTYLTTSNTNYPSGYSFHLPLAISEGIPNGGSATRTTSFTYDSNGNMLTKTVHDASGQAQPDRVWTYTYDSTGLMLTAQDPMLNTTAFSYTNGSLATVTDALSHVTTFSNFTSGGRPQTVTDSNGVVHHITYDARQRVATTSIVIGGVDQVTTNTWNPNDELAKMALPDGTFIQHDYAWEVASNPLTTSDTDAAGNKAQSTFNAAGEVTAVKTLDSASNTYLWRNKTYDALGRVLTETNFDGSKVTTYTYDKNDNVLSVKDGNNHTTSYAYDVFDRRHTVTDANSGVTTINYNLLDQVTSVVAPGTITTSFTPDAFGDVMTQVSPDTGTSTYAYNKNGLLTSKTDGASHVSNYTYDVLNRLSTIAYPANSALNVTNTYDEPTGHGKGIGRLTSVTDAAGTISRTYDERGNITAQARVIGGTTYNTAYGYNSAGRLASVTYPSGATVTYTRDTAGNISSMAFAATGADSTSVFNSAAYLPFGPLKTITYNDGITETLAYDHDLNLSTQNAGATGSINLTYGYDPANNLSSVTDAVTASNTQTFGYDVLDRLTSAVSGTGGYGTLGYTYNANGNPLTSTVSGVTTTFTTTANTNRVTAASATGHSWAYGYTAAGNTSSVQMDSNPATTYTYGADNKLASVSNGTTAESYLYNASGGLRASKTNAGVTSKYSYDLAGRLIGEATAGSADTLEHIFLGGRLVGQYNPTTGNLLSVHTDRMGSPFLVNDKTKTLQWKTSYQPYGQTLNTSGTLAQNVRLPGQYADASFGNYHNGFRDYMPITATNPLFDHYAQADLIGLGGGENIYAYVGGKPLRYSDKRGLDHYGNDDMADRVAGIAGQCTYGACDPTKATSAREDAIAGLDWIGTGATAVTAGSALFGQGEIAGPAFVVGLCSGGLKAFLEKGGNPGKEPAVDFAIKATENEELGISVDMLKVLTKIFTTFSPPPI